MGLVLGVCVTAGVVSVLGIVGGSDGYIPRPAQYGCALDAASCAIAPLESEEALDAFWPSRDRCGDCPLLLARLERTEGALRLASERVAAAEATPLAGLVVVPASEITSLAVGQGLAPEGEWWTATITVYSCIGDSTGAYACTPGVFAGACPGYVLNPGPEGPGVTGPSLYVAAGPSWPCGTEFELVTGQRVIVADRGGLVHDGHLDAYCYDAKNREMCLPGIGPSVRVRRIG